ncbi:MAG: multicopper oxidase domain-containing protein, partial [Actinomycetota bacterium]|nr:multicopper oxidase domain-containing protein [Actinomycetota bacterium]
MSRRATATDPPGLRPGGSRLGVLIGLVVAGLLALTSPAGPPRAAAEEPPGAEGGGAPVEPASAQAEAPPPAPGGHEGGEGLTLGAAPGEDVEPGSGCDPGAPVRRYDLVALAVDITLNRYLDHDPAGRMYALEEDVARVRDEEARNARARSGAGDPAVSAGLQNDAIQPLVIRVHPGECLRLRLRNDLPDGEPASLHLHGSSLQLADGEPAVATNPASVARPGETVTYEWAVASDEPEGTHQFHSHGDTRTQTSHGLVGAVIVEPPGSEWLDPLSGRPLRSGWAAVVRDPAGSDFREFTLVYHEIGHENYQLLDRNGAFVPLVDPLTRAYRPGARALNYRSEPFFNRLALQQVREGRFDESLAYSSYAFGDPATPMPRAYLADPVKERIVHGGSEVFHVHHVHGGSTRWHRQPAAEPDRFDVGLDKHPPLLPEASEQTDAQSMGPSETFDVVHECGAGGCQLSAGDFMYHCHIAHHYFAGMWGLWRVYNTLQDGTASTDGLLPLLPLPDRAEGVSPAVTSAGLVGRPLEIGGRTVTLAEADLPGLVEAQLPPPGTPRGYDASVFDWRREAGVYVGEPETAADWPGYRATTPGARPPLLFDPRTGKLAYPFLRPHLGARPPFAPGHGPAPFLDPLASGRDPPQPGENGPASVCPAGTRLKTLRVHAIAVPIVQNARANLVDSAGQLFVLKEEEEAVRADPRRRTPLAVRANAAEDCVDLVLANEIPDDADHPFSKVSAHIHFVQFDVQASDGVDAGFNYEQTVRPFTVEGERVAVPAPAGSTSLTLERAERFQPGALVAVGVDELETFEVARIAAVSGPTVTFAAPLRFPHQPGEIVTAEFLRHRWYPDVQFGTAYVHDHVNAIASWRHGLIAGLVAEPPGSTYHDPHSGDELVSGTIADIHTAGRLSADVSGSFRELVLFVGDDNPLSRIDRSSGSAFNLRVEPLATRDGDPSQRFSSALHGEPETPVLEAYLGDPLVMRTLVSATNDVHTLHVDGHWFRIEPQSPTSPPTSTVHLGISERYDLVIPAAGGPQRRPGDYLYQNGRSFKLREGSWGLLRVHDAAGGEGLRRLPGRDDTPAAAEGVCPAEAPRRRFEVAAIDVPLPMLGGRTGKVYVLTADREAVASGARPPEPLVLHVDVGDCVEVALTNATAGGPVSFHVDGLAFDPLEGGGVAAGRNPSRAVEVGATRAATFYAHPEVGETVALVRDGGDLARNPGLGLYGAVVVGPRGARYLDPATGVDVSDRSSWRVDVAPRDGPAYRDVTLFLQDEDPGIGTHRMPYTERVRGAVGINYRAAPLADRLASDPDPATVFSGAGRGDPQTPLVEAYAGDPVRLHVLAPWSEQAQVFAVDGHRWPFEPGRAGTPLVSAVQLGGLEAITLPLEAGGPKQLPGDYLYGSHREPYREAGLWGIFRVYDRCLPAGEGLQRLAGAAGCGGGVAALLTGGAAVAVFAGLTAAGAIPLRRWRRRRSSGAPPLGN